MIAKLIVEGKEFPIEIQDPELQKMLTSQKKTGYERVETGKEFYFQHAIKGYGRGCDRHEVFDDKYYDVANYYSDETVAKNNARADTLMRQLRRFAVEHRSSNISRNKCMYSIAHRISDNDVILCPNKMLNCHYMDIWFDTEDAAWQAIQMFYNELVWYFTEYKDSL